MLSLGVLLSTRHGTTRGRPTRGGFTRKNDVRRGLINLGSSRATLGGDLRSKQGPVEKRRREKVKITESPRQKKSERKSENKPFHRDAVESEKLCALIQRQQQQQQLVSCLVRSSRAECHHDANRRRGGARERARPPRATQRAIEPMAVNESREVMNNSQDRRQWRGGQVNNDN